jgi:hypothetical protein
MYGTKFMLKQYTLIALTFLLVSCSAGMPIGEAEIVAISEIETITGVATAMNNPLAQVLEEKITGTRIVIWPGARYGNEQLWNLACLVRTSECRDLLVRYLAGPGYAMRWMRMSEFAKALTADGWHVVQGVGQAMSTALTGFAIVPVIAVPTARVLPET